MNQELYDQFIAQVARDVSEKIATSLPEILKDLPSSDELMTVAQAAKHLRLGTSTIRQLEAAGALKKAPGIKEIRFRRSTLDAYGTNPKR